MNRRDFLKLTGTAAVFASLPLVGAEKKQPGKNSTVLKGTEVTRRKDPKTGEMIPLLGYGCMRWPRRSGGGIDYAATRKLVARAMQANCNYFDTAYMYHGGESESCMGEVLRAYPRESYYLADKMPVWMARQVSDVERIFKDQLKKCRTSYFDFYLLHSLGRANWDKAEKFRTYEFLARMKKEGKIRRLGFSFHDTPEVLAEIIPAHPWDFAQIQLNYLDWELYRSKEQYEMLTKAGIPVIVMEPLRGGALATLSPEAETILRQAAPDRSCASWAFRFAAGLPNVLTVLSGMTEMSHLEDNLKTFSPLMPLSESENGTLQLALAAYRKKLAVPCTACRYCMPCPVGVEIPKIFGLYNQYRINRNRRAFSRIYSGIPEESRASACVNCRKCEKRCPQKIRIPEELKKIASEMEK